VKGERPRSVDGPAWEEWIRQAEDPARVADKPEALDDLLVLDLSRRLIWPSWAPR
jgi:hypothetical protein